MSSKAETQSLLQGFIKSVERQFDTKVKAIRSDNGAEFIMSHFFKPLVLFIKQHVLKLSNKMRLSKESINIYLM